MPDDTPIGAPAITDPCGPCATPPSDCLADLLKAQQEICDLKTNYQDLLRKYGVILAGEQGQKQQIQGVLDSIALLEKQLQSNSATNCSKLGGAQTSNAVIVCVNGVMKVMPAPANDGAVLTSQGGLWTTSTLNLGLIRKPVEQYAWQSGTLGPGSHDQAVTLPAFPTFTSQCWACFGVNLVGLPSGNGSTNASFNGNGIGHTGSGAEDNLFDVFVPLGGPTGTFNLTSAGSIVTMSVNVILKFYDYR